jgi:hypothetical protein
VFSIEVPAREKDDLKEEPIVVRLRKVGNHLPLHPATCPDLSMRRPVAPATMVSEVNRYSPLFLHVHSHSRRYHGVLLVCKRDDT